MTKSTECVTIHTNNWQMQPKGGPLKVSLRQRDNKDRLNYKFHKKNQNYFKTFL